MKKSDVDKEMATDFDFLIKKAKLELQLSDEEIVKLPSVQMIIKDQNKTPLGKSIMWYSSLFLLFIGLPATIIWSVYTGTRVGEYFATM